MVTDQIAQIGTVPGGRHGSTAAARCRNRGHTDCCYVVSPQGSTLENAMQNSNTGQSGSGQSGTNQSGTNQSGTNQSGFNQPSGNQSGFNQQTQGGGGGQLAQQGGGAARAA